GGAPRSLDLVLALSLQLDRRSASWIARSLTRAVACRGIALARTLLAKPRHILITGASSGIGASLAQAYAAPGIRLSLGGRDEKRLAAVAELCLAAGAEVSQAQLDVRDAEAMARWIEHEDSAVPLDLVIANAGISAGTGGSGETPEQARRIFAVNCDGVVNTVLPAIDVMRRRRRGQIAIVSSV